MNYKIKIIYDGTKYKGWQRLGNGELTIQGKIEEILTKYFRINVEIIGSSRTDAGVHAAGQIANFHIDKELNLQMFLKEINHYLPEDISITTISKEDERFHSRFNVSKKVYRYRIWTSSIGDPFNRKYYYQIEDELDIDKMKSVAEVFTGIHDFTTFTNAKSKKKSMEREVYKIDIINKKSYIDVVFTGNGFLYNMIRRMMTIIIDAGLNNINAKNARRMLEAKDRSLVKYMVPAKGLMLMEIKY
ncbi:tRNA pseudouridine(38-40) synthase TruA [Helicovermis profundi]|uniref:tRNA pseudouridine synthase A n=1 Tax=Helicovermis profundi TaxID=3065157 RepID=A0AAU9E5W0_9FIRM|nr:tRNA pseudouridine(38-40) synthase TruA [Clostridia bacterium S502]